MQSYVRSSSVVSRVIAGETLIVPVRGGVGDLASIYSLNPVASLIWSSLAQPCSEETIIARVVEEFFADVPQVAPDVKAFLAEMHSAGLIAPVAVPVGVPA
jgi:hypothetical protein